jgi:hypothetical protein
MGETYGVRWAAAARWLPVLAVIAANACAADPDHPTDDDAQTGSGGAAAAPAVGTDGAGSQASMGSGGSSAVSQGSAGSGGASSPMSMSTGGQTAVAPVDAGNDAAADGGLDAGLGDASSPSDDVTAICKGGMVGMDSMAAKPPGLNVAREYGAVKYLAASGIEIVDFKTTLQVPKVPVQKQTLFIWPGLQCRGASDPAGIGNGILQPVLTWGPSCNPKVPSSSDYYSKWWMAAMYVNVSSSAAGPTGCAGGDFMLTDLGDQLVIEFSVQGTDWKQTVFNPRTMETVDLTIDLKGQVQNWATWAVEQPGGSVEPSDDTIYTQSVLTFSKPVKTCQPNQAGDQDYFSAPVLSPDGLHCCYEEIILRKH